MKSSGNYVVSMNYALPLDDGPIVELAEKFTGKSGGSGSDGKTRDISFDFKREKDCFLFKNEISKSFAKEIKVDVSYWDGEEFSEVCNSTRYIKEKE